MCLNMLPELHSGIWSILVQMQRVGQQLWDCRGGLHFGSDRRVPLNSKTTLLLESGFSLRQVWNKLNLKSD